MRKLKNDFMSIFSFSINEVSSRGLGALSSRSFVVGEGGRKRGDFLSCSLSTLAVHILLSWQFTFEWPLQFKTALLLLHIINNIVIHTHEGLPLKSTRGKCSCLPLFL